MIEQEQKANRTSSRRIISRRRLLQLGIGATTLGVLAAGGIGASEKFSPEPDIYHYFPHLRQADENALRGEDFQTQLSRERTTDFFSSLVEFNLQDFFKTNNVPNIHVETKNSGLVPMDDGAHQFTSTVHIESKTTKGVKSIIGHIGINPPNVLEAQYALTSTFLNSPTPFTPRTFLIGQEVLVNSKTGGISSLILNNAIPYGREYKDAVEWTMEMALRHPEQMYQSLIVSNEHYFHMNMHIRDGSLQLIYTPIKSSTG